MRLRGKKPTKTQKIYISKCGYNCEDWLVAQDNERSMIIVHRHIYHKVKKLPKEIYT